jgi:CDP-diacylglycerol--serine O-phosphatidyltransferase
MGKKTEIRTGIYLLPNLFTTASLFAAFYAMVSTFMHHYESAAVAIFIGMIADGLDGRIARLTNTQSAFGAQYDSLSDMASFGVAPALLLYGHTLHHFGTIGWLLAFMYVAAVALRLARFNTQLEVADKRFFQGLPCPPSAGVMAGIVWLSSQSHWHFYGLNIVIGILTFFMATLMVSNIRYCSFKEIDFKGRVPFLYLLLTVIVFVAIAAAPAIVLFSGFLIFALSGPLYTLRARQFQNKKRKK